MAVCLTNEINLVGTPRPPVRATTGTRLASLAGRPMISIARKDGHSQRDSLANNLPADAADMVKAVHAPQNGQARAQRQGLGSRVEIEVYNESPLASPDQGR